MQTLIDGGIAFIIALQGAGDWLIAPMRFLSYLGNEEFFLLILPMIYWSVDSALGLRMAFILVTSNLFNSICKYLFAGSRPYWVSSHVRALWTTETSFGFPSAHAQNAAAVWGVLALFGRETWIWIGAIILVFLIGLSRVFLGVHYPHDVVFGWLLGAVIFWSFTHYWDPVAAWVRKKTFTQQIFIAFMVSLFMIVLGFGAATIRRDFQIPEIWISNSLLTGTVLPHPVDPNSPFTSAGTFFGIAVGAAWISSIGGYQASGPLKSRVIRYIVGFVGVLILWMGLGEIFPRGEGAIFYALRFIRYALVGCWVAGVAPWIFIKLKLAERDTGVNSV